MKQKITIVANDGDTKIIVTALITHKGGLVYREQRQMRKSVIRHLASVLPDIRWTDYGIENIKIKR